MKKNKNINFINWIGVYTLFTKETKRFCKVYQQTILAPAFTSLLFFLVISIAIGSRVNYEFNYINFLAPGFNNNDYDAKCICKHIFFYIRF